MSDGTLKLHLVNEGFMLPEPAWLTLQEAARRSGLSIGRLRHNAPGKYEPQGLARKDENGAWLISEAADTRFAAVRSAAIESKSDIATRAELAADPVQQEIALARHRIMEELQRQLDENERSPRPISRNDVRDRFAKHLAERGIEGASSPTLKKWRRKWLDGGRDMIALVDERRVGERQKEATNDFAQYFELLEAVWLDGNKPAKSTAITAANVISRREGYAIPHEKTARRRLEQLEKTKLGKVIRHRGGASDFNNKVLPYIPRDRGRINVRRLDGVSVSRVMRSDEIWCADHHICDTIVEHNGKLIRPWVTAILDIRSDKIVGLHWSPKSPNKHNVLLAFRNAVIRAGNCLPDFWYVDNGKDFDAWMFQGMTKLERRRLNHNNEVQRRLGVREQRDETWHRRQVKVDNDRQRAEGILQHLKIQTIHAAPYNARGKPIERFFGIFEESFGRLTYTYCGNTPQNRPEHLDYRLEAGPVPTFKEYIEDAESWILRFHHDSPLTTRRDKGQTRDEVYAANRTSTKPLDSMDKLELLLMPIEKVKVGRMGVTYQGWHYLDPSLCDHFGKYVTLKVDPADITSVGVWELGMTRKIAQATCVDLAAWGVVTDEQSKRINQRIATINRKVKELTAMGGYGYAINNKQAMLADVRRETIRQSPTPAALPAPDSIRMAHTPLDGQSIDVRPALPQLSYDADRIDLLDTDGEDI